MKDIKIDRLEIRLKGIPKKVIHDSINDLGDELLIRFSKDKNILKKRGTIRINKIDLGALKMPKEVNCSTLRGIIADRIIGSILLETQRDGEVK